MIFSARPQDVFKPIQLVISGEDVEGLYIEEIKVGNLSQLAASGRIAVREFKEWELPLTVFDCAQVSQDVSVRIINLSDEAKVCEPFFLGYVVRF